ncbi:NAD(P)-dependent oxidoreductase [Diaminobutyricibacter tongyongensis]|uniref:NAD(P)-dependent oxidoreductase n=2 Tax=Leifsonia tongyongensis TaxID=1268043 RepID=A0A6L9Y2D3_9MICO|nr:NAD(P)-dependent oxidoreductase [Diaminobutyricibacter tongyongensis]
MAVVIREGLASRYDQVVLYQRTATGELHPNETIVVGDLTDLGALVAAAQGVDVIVHLGGKADESDFAEILSSNIVGSYNVFEAARRAGVRRVVYASSNHVVGFYPAAETVNEDTPVRPDSYYGASKVFGEALGRLYHDKWGMEVVALRIGIFRQRPADRRQLALWLSPQDSVELIARSIEADGIGYLLAYGSSANRDSWWDSTRSWEALGYHPNDDAADYQSDIEEVTEPERYGGVFTAADYQGGVW